MADPFDPAADIPTKLRQRIERWRTSPPRLQFSQYGPLNKYFQLRFPDALVKPQGLLRPKDHMAPVAYLDMLNELDNVGDSSIDSTGQAVETKKSYPDFIVASYYGQNADGGWPSDFIRLVCEIGSLYDAPKATEAQKNAIYSQLHDYMVLLGHEGERWDKRVVGVAILGTEVSFVKHRKVTGGDGRVKWTKGTWHSMYGKVWDTEMKRIATTIEKD